VTDEQIKYMTNRFLGWRLPENFNPDDGISFKPYFNEHTGHPMKSEPTGTNLFDFTQAREMVRYLVDGMPMEDDDDVVGNPSVEEWADWIVSRYKFCEENAGESLREIALVALRNIAAQRTVAQESPEENPYFVEVDDNGCSKCGAGRNWVVVDPDGTRGGTSYGLQEDADDLAEDLNRAFNRRRR